MPTPVVPVTLRRGLVAAGVLLVVVLLVLSHGFGRAVPTNNYRPLLTADAVESGCYPLPGDARLDGLSYQVRWDEDGVSPDGAPRRTLRGQYNLVELDEAVDLLVAAFTEVGFEVADRTGGESGAEGRRVELRHPRAAETVAITARELPDTSAETLVRGEFVLDLPVVALAKDDPVCFQQPSTKRYGEWESTR